MTQPAKRLTLLVGANEGVGLDRHARAAVPFLNAALRGPEFEVKNLPGDGGMNAIRSLIDAPPNGTTLGWAVGPSYAARTVDRQDPSFLDRIRLVGAIAREPIAFVAPAAAPLESVTEMLERGSADRDALTLGTPPPGSPPHLAVLRMQAVAQTRLSIVTFPSAAATLAAVVAGNVGAAALALSDAIDALRDGKLSGIGVAARDRLVMLPDLPALQEGGVPLSATIRRGLCVPVGTPDDVVARFADALNAVASDAAYQELAERSGFLATFLSGADWTATMRRERELLGKIWETDPWLASNGG